MGIPLMLQEGDIRKIDQLKRALSLRKNIDVIRVGLDLLEKKAKRMQKIERWKRAAALVGESSREINKEFQFHFRFIREKL